MLEIGHEFVRNGKKYIVVDFVNTKAKRYALLSFNDDEGKIDYEFFELKEDANGYHFKKVKDDNTVSQLFDKLGGQRNE